MNTKRLAGIVLGIIIIMMLFMFAGCSSTENNTYSQSLGSVKKNQEVTKLFNTYQYHPHYKYYFAGFMKDAEGVFGIHNDYLIEEECGRATRAVHWHEFETTPQNLKILVKGIEQKGEPFGADIFDHDGQQVGILYTFETNKPYRQFVQKSEGNLICVIPQYYYGGHWRGEE